MAKGNQTTPTIKRADGKVLNPPLTRQKQPRVEDLWEHRVEVREIHGQLVDVKVFRYPLQPKSD